MASGALMLPGSSNTYVRNTAATGHLIVQYARNPKEFPFARYVQYRDVKKDAGFFMQMTAEQAARLVGGTLAEFVWPDGADRPVNNNGTESFNFKDYKTQRHNFGFTLGDKSRERADWSIGDTEAANHVQQAMTARARKMHIQLETTGNWDSGHRKDVTTIDGILGRWDQSTTARNDVKKSINYAVNQIRLATLGVVKSNNEMRGVMAVETAQKIGECQEMIHAFIQSAEARKHWEGKYPDYSDYGLPNFLYGIEVVVEDTVMVTSRRGASTVVKTDVCQDGVVYLVSRPGGLVSKASSGPSYSSLMCFTYEDMTVETKHDVDNRRHVGNVVIDSFEGIIAPASCFRFENVIA